MHPLFALLRPKNSLFLYFILLVRIKNSFTAWLQGKKQYGWRYLKVRVPRFQTVGQDVRRYYQRKKKRRPPRYLLRRTIANAPSRPASTSSAAKPGAGVALAVGTCVALAFRLIGTYCPGRVVDVDITHVAVYVDGTDPVIVVRVLTAVSVERITRSRTSEGKTYIR